MKKLLLTLSLILAGVCARADAWTDDYPAVETRIEQPVFANRSYNICDYGAGPDADAAVNQAAINRAIAVCSGSGGGRVLVPAGTYSTGALRLLDNVDLHLDEHAHLLFVFDPELYPVVETRWEGLDCNNLSPCIYAKDAVNIALTGHGTIDGGADRSHWWPWCGSKRFGWQEGMPSQKDLGRPRLMAMAEDGVDRSERRFSAADCLRPQLINFYNCTNVLLEDLTLLRSPFWVVHPLLCRSVTLRGLKIVNDGPNGDGCDPESCDGVLIENCYFDTGDDCIAIKSGRNNDGRLWNTPSQNIIVRNCTMRNGHGGVVVGSEISGGARNIFVEHCTMDSPLLERVVRIKTNTCRGGVVEHVYARNIEVGQCKEAVLKINLDYEAREQCCRGYIPTVRHIYLDSVTCRHSRYGVMIIGLDSLNRIYDINIDNCRFDGVADGNSLRGRYSGLYFRNTCINDTLYTQQPYSRWMTASEMRRTPRSYLLDFSKKPKWSYVMGIQLEAMLNTGLRYGDSNVVDYCREYVDTMILPDGRIRGYKLGDYNLDNVRTGKFLTEMQRLEPRPQVAAALDTLMRQLDRQPRTREGVYWHKAIYAWQVWLDGIFMGLPVRVANAAAYAPDRAAAIYDDAVDQLKRTYARTLDPATGLNRHAWDETHQMFWADSVTGLSAHSWARAQGWYTMALVEILDALPADYTRRSEVEQLLQQSLDAVIRWRDPETRLWYQVLDSPGRPGNYLESTASSMFTYALLRAANKGYAGPAYGEYGRESYRALLDRFVRLDADGNISLTDCCSVAGLGPGTSEAVRQAAPQVTKSNTRRNGSYAYYLSEPRRDNDAKGLGPFIWASLEYEQ